MLLALLVPNQLAPVDLEVEELVAALMVGTTLRNTATMIKVFQMMMLLNRSQITMKPSSTFYRLKFLIEKKLPTACLLLIVIVERYMRSETTQMHMRSIVLSVEGNIALRTALP